MIDLTEKNPPRVGESQTYPEMDVSPTMVFKKLTEPNAVIVFYGLDTAHEKVQIEFNKIIESLPDTTKIYEVLKYR